MFEHSENVNDTAFHGEWKRDWTVAREKGPEKESLRALII